MRFQIPLPVATLLAVTIFLSNTLADDLWNRTWTRKDGKTAVGKLAEVNGEFLFLRLEDDSIAKVKITELSLNDQQYVKEWEMNPPQRPAHVPEGAHFHNGQWYKIIYKKLTWEEAAAEARKMGGHLAKIETEQELIFLTNFWKDKNYFWLGATDKDEEGVWKWSDGTPVTRSYWDKGQPSNGDGKEHYASMRPGGKWNDVRGDSPSITGFIIQWKHKP